MAKNINNDADYKATKPKDRDYKISDGGGLSLLVKPDGIKRWVFRYRFDGKQNALGFGLYPDTTLDDARLLANEARTNIKQGIDPGEVKKQHKARLMAERRLKAEPSKRVGEIAAAIAQQMIESGLPTTNIIEFKVTVEVVRWE